MICFPNCKINLGLFVTRKRDDGYHDLQTVFYPLGIPSAAQGYTQNPINDILEITPSSFPTTQLHLSGIPVQGALEENLVWKAYQLLKTEYLELIKPVDIFLHKAMPMGAGIGGGSADAAFMLHLMNDYFQLGLTTTQLAEHALRLGSDCPFFIYNTPHYATGRGEVLQPINVDLSAYTIQLICPKLHVSTRDAFANISPQSAPFTLQNLGNLPIAEWAAQIGNDFEKTVFVKHPELETIKNQLYAQGALYASMTGTGAAIYGIFPKGSHANIKTGAPYRQFIIGQT